MFYNKDGFSNIMARVVNPNEPGKTRSLLMKSLAAAVRELSGREGGGEERRDIGVFVMLTLAAIKRTVEGTVSAWEKRDYWVKADRFRQEWGWVDRSLDRISQIVQEERWDDLDDPADEIRGRTDEISVSKKLAAARPWKGSWNAMKERQEIQ